MKGSLIGAASAVALVGATMSAAIAQQTPDERRQGPSAQDRMPEGKAPARGNGRESQKGVDRQKGAERPDKDRPRGAERPDKDRPKGAERPDKDRPKGAERPDKDRPKGAERPDKDRPRGAERPDKDRPKGAERPDKDRPKGAERPDKDRPKGAERPDRDRPKGAERRGGRVQLSEQQRSKVSERLRRSRIERTRIDIDVGIGARVPRSVRLHALPGAVIEIAPAYRGYRYVALQSGAIVIVDPQTYAVVDVISGGPRRAERPGGGQLTLSAEDRRFIFRNVPKERAVDVRTRLGLGATVPRGVGLQTFPSRVVTRIPEIREYRYIFADGEVVIVDPSDRSIVLTIGG